MNWVIWIYKMQGSKNRIGRPTGQATGSRVIGSTVVQPGQLENNKMIIFNQILKNSKIKISKNVKYTQSQYKIHPTVVQSCRFFIRYFAVTETKRGSAVLRFGFESVSEFFLKARV